MLHLRDGARRAPVSSTLFCVALACLWALATAIVSVPATPAQARADTRSTAQRHTHHAPHRAGSFVAVEANPSVFDLLYRYGQNTPGPGGAYGPNITAPRGSWFVEYQRAGAPNVIGGVLRTDQDPSLVGLGLQMFHFALAREATDGSFPGSAWPFHGTAMFLSEAAPALIILRNSSLAARFSQEIAWESSLMRRASYAMVRYIGGPGRLDDYSKNHRWFEAAIALGAVGKLSHDATLIEWSTRYARRGIEMERQNGIMPEDQGHDSGYQGLGMVNAIRYLNLVARGSLHAALYGALARGESWLISRVGADGTVKQRGDTRSDGCRERDPMGRCKTLMYAPIYSALAHWAAVSQDPRFEKAAHSVWYRAGYWARK